MKTYSGVEGLSVWARRAVLEALYANILNVVRNVCVGVRTNFTLCSTALAFNFVPDSRSLHGIRADRKSRSLSCWAVKGRFKSKFSQ